MEEDGCGGAPIPAPAPAPAPSPTPAPAPAPGRGLQDELTCAVCLEYFRDPVMVSDCGHNFCRACVTQCWEEAGRGLCCPQCREPVPQRLFRPNRQLANIVDIVRQLDAVPAPAPAPAPACFGAPPGPAAAGPGPDLCERHGEPLKLFCQQDQRAVCLVCYLAWDHRGHRVVPVEEAALGFQEAPQEHLACLRKGREESKVQRERQGEELLKQTETERQKIIAECKELRGFLEEKEQFLLSRLEELDRDIVKRKDESVFKLSEEICHIDKLLSEKGGESEPMDQTDQSVASTVSRTPLAGWGEPW